MSRREARAAMKPSEKIRARRTAPDAASAEPATAAAAPADDEVARSSIGEIALALIDRDPDLNPRTTFDEEELAGLAASIKDKGVVQPILIRPYGDLTGRYRLVAGERRLRAAAIAGLDAIPAIVRVLDDAQAREIALIENIQRVDLHPLEEARCYRAIIDAKREIDPQMTEADAKRIIAEATRKTTRYVEQRLQLMKLPEKDQNRMLLPEEHRDHLSLTNARYAAQNHVYQADQAAKKAAELQAFKITPEQLLMLAEIADKIDRHPDRDHYSKRTEVAFAAAADADLKWMGDKNLASARRDDHNWQHPENNGRWHVYLGWKAADLLKARAPEFSAKKTSVAGLEKLREAARRWPSESAKHAYATTWLNGPFELEPKVKAEQARRAREVAEQEAARARESAREAAESVQGRKLLKVALAASGLSGDTVQPDEIAMALEAAGGPLPWSLDPKGDLVDANGDPLRAGNLGLIARRLLIVHGVNQLVGLQTPAVPRQLIQDLEALNVDERVRLKGKRATFVIVDVLEREDQAATYKVQQLGGKGPHGEEIEVARSDIEEVLPQAEPEDTIEETPQPIESDEPAIAGDAFSQQLREIQSEEAGELQAEDA